MTNDEETLARLALLRDHRVFAAAIKQHTMCTQEAAEHTSILATTALNQVWDNARPPDMAKVTAEAIRLSEELKSRPRTRAVVLDPEHLAALEKLVEESEGVVPVSVNSLVGMALDAFLEGAR